MIIPFPPATPPAYPRELVTQALTSPRHIDSLDDTPARLVLSRPELVGKSMYLWIIELRR